MTQRRLTDEELADIEHAAEQFIEMPTRRETKAMVAELRSLRSSPPALALTAEEREAAMALAVENRGMLPWLVDAEEIEWRKRAIVVLDRLCKEGG